MRSDRYIRIVALFLFSFLLIGCSKSQKPSDPAALEIRQLLAPGRVAIQLAHVADSLFSPELLKLFYEKREFDPAWSDASGMLASADSLKAMVRSADREGLEPQDYHIDAIDVLFAKMRTPDQENILTVRAELDVILSDAFMLYACHLSEGKIDRDSLRPRQSVGIDKRKYAELLEASLTAEDVGKALRSLAPAHSWYRSLRELLALYRSRTKNGVWSRVPPDTALKPGCSGRTVFALRNRLLVLGDLQPRSGSTTNVYDSALVDAVRIFQKRHGYEPTGIADSATIAALNIQPQKRIDQIKATMERWRWMPHTLGRKYAVINIPDFKLAVVENEREVLSMKVVLGLPNWQTPVFSSALEQVLFNSHWMAPEDIVEKELINYMKADSNYLPSNNMSLWRKLGDSLVKIDPRAINWPEMTPEKIDFFLRQEGGPQNIMGQVKFLIPNKYNVYLHDTPYREDFQKNVRMFSHGCIRLEKPFDFAENILQQFPEWTRTKIDTVVSRKTESSIRLKKTIPVHIVYSTVWKASDGSIQFRDDYYGLDRRLNEILSMSAPR
jgi:murein L,D-transpeptidase YcbB/YkuD